MHERHHKRKHIHPDAYRLYTGKEVEKQKEKKKEGGEQERDDTKHTFEVRTHTVEQQQNAKIIPFLLLLLFRPASYCFSSHVMNVMKWFLSSFQCICVLSLCMYNVWWIQTYPSRNVFCVCMCVCVRRIDRIKPTNVRFHWTLCTDFFLLNQM